MLEREKFPVGRYFPRMVSPGPRGKFTIFINHPVEKKKDQDKKERFYKKHFSVLVNLSNVTECLTEGI